MTALNFGYRANGCHTGGSGMTMTEIATGLRVALVNCINRDKSLSLADRYYFVGGQRDFSDEEIISFLVVGLLFRGASNAYVRRRKVGRTIQQYPRMYGASKNGIPLKPKTIESLLFRS